MRFLLITILLLPFPALAQATGDVRATGTVRSAGQPIPGATVTAVQGDRKVTTTTDEYGAYDFRLAPGTWTLHVEMMGFAAAQRDVTVTAANASPVDWNIEIRPPTVAARVLQQRPPSGQAAGPVARGGNPRAGQQQANGVWGGRGGSPERRPGANGNGGFRRLGVNGAVDNTENQIQAAMDTANAQPATATAESDANEAFLLNGSISSGLQAAGQDDARMRQGGWDPASGAAGSPFAAQEGGQPGGPGGPGGFGGRRGPGGGPGGFGGRGGFGGPGGFGGRGRGGPNRPDGRGPIGRNGGAFGNRVGRGRQGMRGSLFFSLDNSALDARPFSLTGQSVDRPSYAQSRFGLVFGGPLNLPKVIHSPRTFVFFTYFGTRSRNPYQGVGTVPTQAEREGDFSEAATRTPITIYDPLTGLPFNNNRIPITRLDPVALGLLRFVPLPNQPGTIQNYQYLTSVGNNTNNLGLRANRNLTAKDRLDANTNFQFRDSKNAQLFGFQDASDGLGGSASVGWTRTISQNVVNVVRFNFSRNRNEALPFFAYGQNVAAELGINGVSPEPINYGPPNLSFTNFGPLTDGSPSLVRNQTAGISEGVTVVHGVHNLGFGGDYRRMQLNTRTDSNARGTFAFTGLLTSAFDAQGQPIPGTGFDFADFLLGLPQSSSVRFGDTNTYFRSFAWSAYAQDDWRMKPNFTLTLGLRYEYFAPYREKYNHIANLDLSPLLNGVAVVLPDRSGPYSGAFPATLIDPDTNNFSPRLALAWRPIPARQFQVRAGYAVFYNGSIYNQFPSRLAAQPPFGNTAQLNTSLQQPLTIENGFAAAPAQAIRNTFGVDRNYRVGYAQTWNLSIQQSLPHNVIMELGYFGTKGTDLDVQRLPNRAAPGSPLTAEQRRQIGNATGFTWETSDGNSIYHAAQVRLMRRMSHGMAVNALYTFSKSIDNASTIGGGAAVVAQNDRDLRAERGLSSFDRRHALNVNYVLASPVTDSGRLLAGKGRLTSALKDWTLSGGLTATSGAPFTARVLGNQADTAGTGATGSGRADATGDPVDTGSGFFNPGAFTIPSPGTFGNAGRNTIEGPWVLSLNLSLARAIRLDERRRLEIRVDSRNFTNRVSFTSFGTVVNAADYGLPLAAAGMRTVTLTARLRF